MSGRQARGGTAGTRGTGNRETDQLCGGRQIRHGESSSGGAEVLRRHVQDVPGHCARTACWGASAPASPSQTPSAGRPAPVHVVLLPIADAHAETESLGTTANTSHCPAGFALFRCCRRGYRVNPRGFPFPHHALATPPAPPACPGAQREAQTPSPPGEPARASARETRKADGEMTVNFSCMLP